MSCNPDVVSFTGHVETTVQALRIIHAAYQGIIPRITRQLDDAEHKAIKSGTVFVFSVDEGRNNLWTDGLLWSPSQNVGNFLVCHEIKDGLQSSPGLFKHGALIKKSIMVRIDRSELQLISYYTLEDICSGKLEARSFIVDYDDQLTITQLPTSRPDIMSLYMPPHIFCLTNFRLPLRIGFGPDGKPYIVESEDHELEYQFEDSRGYNSGKWPTETQTPASTVRNPLPGRKSADELRGSMGDLLLSSPPSQQGGWSPKGSAISSAGDHTLQATIDTSSSSLHSQSDRDIPPACRRQEAGTTLQKDGSEAPKNRRRSRKSRRAPRKETEMEDGPEGIFASQPNAIPFIQNAPGPGGLPLPFQSWAYYPPLFMVTIPVIPIVPMFAPSQWTSINSGNVTNVHMYDAANDNSTNVRIKKVHGKEKNGGRGRKAIDEGLA